MSLPGALSGSVRVAVPKFNVWLGLLCFALALAGEMSGSGFLLAVGIGGLGVMPLGVAFQWLAQRRLDRKVAHWPVMVQVEPGPEGTRIALVTSTDGSVSTLELPDDYDPADDDGEWFIRQVAPDLAHDLFDEEEP